VVVPVILKAAGPSDLFQRGQDLHHTHEGSIPRLGGLALVAAFIGVEVLIAALWPEETNEDARKVGCADELPGHVCARVLG